VLRSWQVFWLAIHPPGTFPVFRPVVYCPSSSLTAAGPQRSFTSLPYQALAGTVIRILSSVQNECDFVEGYPNHPLLSSKLRLLCPPPSPGNFKRPRTHADESQYTIPSYRLTSKGARGICADCSHPLAGSQQEYIRWLLCSCSDGREPETIISEEAIDLFSRNSERRCRWKIICHWHWKPAIRLVNSRYQLELPNPCSRNNSTIWSQR